MIVVGLDPGTTDSAYVIWDGIRVIAHHTGPNDLILSQLVDLSKKGLAGMGRVHVLVLEQVVSFGMPVGKEVLETVFWSGRFAQGWTGKWDRISRKAIKIHLCESARANDANIRQALLDRIGVVGTKREPGPLFGIKGHEFAALAVAVTWFDQHGTEQ